MKLKFLGTRGYIDIRTRRHRMHSSLLVWYGGTDVVVDRGADWLNLPGKTHPRAIFLTHAHPDHAWGLKEGAPCRVYATEETWQVINRYPITQRSVVEPGRPVDIGRLRFQAFSVEHSLRAPAVGYRISAGKGDIFYVPDLVYIRERKEALTGVGLYVGDGASITRPIVRRRDETLIGHASIRTQLGWCRDEGVPQAIFTHCGSQIVGGDERRLGAQVRALAEERGLTARIAHDGMEAVVRGGALQVA